MARRRHDETESGLFSASWGDRPFTVRVREEVRGGNLVYDYADPITRKRRKPSLGFGVRDERGRVDEELKAEALELAKTKSAELRLLKLRQEVKPAHMTVADAFARYHDPERGGLPASDVARRIHRAARTAWENWLTPERPWNQITRADVWALADKIRSTGKVETARSVVKCLRACYRWLDEQAELEGLKNPVKGFPWKKLVEGYQPKRERYTREEIEKLFAVRGRLDPRFGLFLALADEAGVRGKAARILRRSDVDAPLPLPPDPELVPHGWIVFPALKGQAALTHFLTAFERAELEAAFAGYLAPLEARWREAGADYPLFPPFISGQKLAADRALPVSADVPLRWLREAERVADVKHVPGRAWHGLRRAWSDYMRNAIGLDAATTAGGWSSRATLEGIYLEEEKYADRAMAREAMERKRRKPE